MKFSGDTRPYACLVGNSKGRRLTEVSAPTRTEYQRDRDRIVRSASFRRLVYKTQVFLNHEGDLFRTRLTHSLEVAQLGRSIARSIGLDEDLVEAISLAHDLGHTPFGHAGQDALNQCLISADLNSAGFEHNIQGLRVIDTLEEGYPKFNGLNLTFETREGILKHCSLSYAQYLEASEPNGIGARFIKRQQPSLEAQLCNLADEIAYNAHDIDDGVRSGLLDLEKLATIPLFEQFLRETLTDYPAIDEKRLLFESIRRMLSFQVYDVLAATQSKLDEYQPLSVQHVRELPRIVCFSAQTVKASIELKRFLRVNLYRHPQVTETTDKAKQVIRDLFAVYLERPEEWAAPRSADGSRMLRALADYIAGMTDRFALREHERLTGTRLFAH